MNYRMVNKVDGLRTFVLVFQTDDEIKQGMMEFIKSEHIDCASLTAIGAFRDVTLGYFDVEKNDYLHFKLGEQVEVLNLTGNIAFDVDKNQPRIHAHVVVGKRDGSAHGGHLFEAHVRPTLEVLVTETPQHLRRHTDPVTGLGLIALDDQQLTWND